MCMGETTDRSNPCGLYGVTIYHVSRNCKSVCLPPPSLVRRAGAAPLYAGGKPLNGCIFCNSCLAGFIPAHAGERQVVHLSDVRSLGSSPLTRGKACLKCQMLDLAGVHPRSRGGKAIFQKQHATLGSSPLTRGKVTAGQS